MSASGAVANVAFPPCTAHFLMTHNTALLSHWVIEVTHVNFCARPLALPSPPLTSYTLPLSPHPPWSAHTPTKLMLVIRPLFIHTERTVLFPFRTSNVMRSVWSSHLLLSSVVSRPSSAKDLARSLMGSPRCDFTLTRKVALPAPSGKNSRNFHP